MFPKAAQLPVVVHIEGGSEIVSINMDGMNQKRERGYVISEDRATKA
jgi:hypothetical protein